MLAVWQQNILPSEFPWHNVEGRGIQRSMRDSRFDTHDRTSGSMSARHRDAEGRRLRPSGARRRAAVCAVMPLFASSGAAVAQAPSTATAWPTAVPAVDTASLASGPYSEMSALLEKTIFKVDVLTLRIRVGRCEADRLERVLRGGRHSDALADSVAEIMVSANDAWARIVFERGVGLGQFLDGVLGNVRKAWKAGLIEAADYERMSEMLPVWFGFLEDRRIREGDRLLYRIRKESLRTIYVGVEGAVLLDQTDLGASPPRILLGSYFAPGSDFRKALVRSLLAGS